MQKEPTMDELKNLAIPKIAGIWEHVAIQLDITPNQILIIKGGGKRTSVQDIVIEILRKWLDKTKGSDPEKADKLIKAVESIGHKAAAKEFKTGWLYEIAILYIATSLQLYSYM